MKEHIKEEIQVYTNLEDAIRSGTDFVYKKTNDAFFEAIPLNKLLAVISDIGDSSVNKSYIPKELIYQVDLSVEAPKVIYNKDNYNIVYYSPFQSDTKENVLVIIKLFNSLPSIKITIYTTNRIHEQIRGFANENITFYTYDKPDRVLIKASMVITHGYSVRSFINQKIPTLVIGTYGLGGWITPENINYFLKDNFKGRPGGEFGENIPSQIFVDELLEIREERNLNNILIENALKLDEYLEQLSPKPIDSAISSIDDIYRTFKLNNKRDFLRPKLASNVVLFNTTDQLVIIKRKKINDVLFSIPESEINFIEDLKKGLTCKELRNKHEIGEDDFWEIMVPLWECKAIIFSL